jgi:hypothetical protein
MSNKKTLPSNAFTTIDIRSFVRKYVDDIPNREFNLLMNQISFLDQFRSIQLPKADEHHLNTVISKAVWFYKPDMLYKKNFTFDEKKFTLELIDFNHLIVYRAIMTYPDGKIKVTLKCFAERFEAEEYLVEKLSNELLLEKI